MKPDTAAVMPHSDINIDDPPIAINHPSLPKITCVVPPVKSHPSSQIEKYNSLTHALFRASLLTEERQ